MISFIEFLQEARLIANKSPEESIVKQLSPQGEIKYFYNIEKIPTSKDIRSTFKKIYPSIPDEVVNKINDITETSAGLNVKITNENGSLVGVLPMQLFVIPSDVRDEVLSKGVSGRRKLKSLIFKDNFYRKNIQKIINNPKKWTSEEDRKIPVAKGDQFLKKK
jgi:hypothetical protein